MSTEANTQLYELAAEHIDYWAGEGIGKAIELACDTDDLDRLSELLKESTRIMFDQEYQNDDPTTDEQAEQYGSEQMTTRAENARDAAREEGKVR